MLINKTLSCVRDSCKIKHVLSTPSEAVRKIVLSFLYRSHTITPCIAYCKSSRGHREMSDLKQCDKRSSMVKLYEKFYVYFKITSEQFSQY
uniref:Uncharacterized protein n=1 Tax=Romanomermis culicivorax TaxID=13658 RepID=A0A915HM95_ROMCU